MSSDAVGYVVRHSPYGDKVLVAHFMVADSANDMNDNLFWLPMGELAKKMRASRTTAKAAMHKLEADGFVELVEESKGGGKAGDGASTWRFLFPEKPVIYETRRRRAVVNSRSLQPGSSGQPLASSGQSTESRRHNASLLNPREPKERGPHKRTKELEERGPYPERRPGLQIFGLSPEERDEIESIADLPPLPVTVDS